jgi:hypothetical protein
VCTESLINNILVQALKVCKQFLKIEEDLSTFTLLFKVVEEMFHTFLVRCHLAYFSSWIRKDHYCKQRLINYIDTKAFVLFS